MEESGEFKLADFRDTIHLHSGGGAKLLNKIVQVMAQDQATMAAINSTTAIANGASNGGETDSGSADPAFRRFREATRQEAMIVQKESPPL